VKGDRRDCQFISAAARLIASAPRLYSNARSRNSTGSSPAAAASSSVKLSTAKQLAGLPGEPVYGMTPEAGLPKGFVQGAVHV